MERKPFSATVRHGASADGIPPGLRCSSRPARWSDPSAAGSVRVPGSSAGAGTVCPHEAAARARPACPCEGRFVPVQEPRAVDVLVAGAGPTGTALAAVLAERGLDVLVVAPNPERGWRATYGAWADELGGEPGSLTRTALETPGTLRWSGVWVGDDAGDRRLNRPYVRLDTPALQRALTARAARAGVRVQAGTAVRAEHSQAGSVVVLEDGRKLRTRSVVDASGHRGTLVQRARPTRPPADQAAYGVVAELGSPPAPPGSAVLMDFSAGHLPVAERDVDPTFLYAMHLGGDRWFVEETSLARRPALPMPVLARRLDRRLASLGCRPGPALDVERVHIPMDTPLPVRNQRVLAIGAAASAVHPATGYLLAASLRTAPALADAVLRGLGPGGGPARAAALGWQVLWPPDRVRVRRLHAFGLEALLSMDGPATRDFFRAFFAAPPQEWAAYLSGGHSPQQTLRFMARLYAGAPPHVRRRLRRSALGREGLALTRAASGRLVRSPGARLPTG